MMADDGGGAGSRVREAAQEGNGGGSVQEKNGGWAASDGRREAAGFGRRGRRIWAARQRNPSQADLSAGARVVGKEKNWEEKKIEPCSFDLPMAVWVILIND